MPTDGTLLLEHMPKDKQYLVTALSVFFSFGAVLSAVVGLLILPNNSCSPASTTPCDVNLDNRGWKYLLITLGLLVRIAGSFVISMEGLSIISDFGNVLCPHGVLSFT